MIKNFNRKILLFVFLFFSFRNVGTVYGQTVLSSVKENVFDVGEELNYKLKYGFITAAEATLRIESSDVQFEGKDVFHLVATGKTAGTFDIFYKVRNRYDSYIDQKTLLPFLYTENIREGGYSRQDKARFYQNDRKVVTNKDTYKGSEQTFDVISSYYFARSLDVNAIRQGDKFILKYFLNDAITPMEIQYVGKERVCSSLGTFNCLKFSPSIQPGRIFKKNSKLYLWITDDANRIPIKAEVEILIGSITLELESAKGLKFPSSSMIQD